MSLRETLRGTGVAIITPFNSKGDIDFPALERVINSVINGGVEYIITLGTTGETLRCRKKKKKGYYPVHLRKSKEPCSCSCWHWRK